MRVRVIGPKEREARRKYQAKYRSDRRDDKDWCHGESVRTGVSKKFFVFVVVKLNMSIFCMLLSYVLAVYMMYDCQL